MPTAVECVNEVNYMGDSDGVPLARKCMIRCGLAKDLLGSWRKGQLSEELQFINDKYPEQFDGIPPNVSSNKVDTETYSDVGS